MSKFGHSESENICVALWQITRTTRTTLRISHTKSTSTMANNVDSPDVFQDAIQGNTPRSGNLSVVQDVEEADGISPLFGRVLFGSSSNTPNSPTYFRNSRVDESLNMQDVINEMNEEGDADECEDLNSAQQAATNDRLMVIVKLEDDDEIVNDGFKNCLLGTEVAYIRVQLF